MKRYDDTNGGPYYAPANNYTSDQSLTRGFEETSKLIGPNLYTPDDINRDGQNELKGNVFPIGNLYCEGSEFNNIRNVIHFKGDRRISTTATVILKHSTSEVTDI
ncbi:hypothetical protein V1477_021211 [Vespula maculifrons]|uniref:Uncharacterized protein n=1 Tax=Vespula maculifrons TaxID=7453 RepID=A0ABD2AGH6_VESMC